MSQYVLAHISDVHLTPPPGGRPADLLSKRFFSRLSWVKARRREHLPQVIDAIVADWRAQGGDHLAITGDLTNFAAPEEFAGARRWLESLGPARDVTVSLGNHDMLVDVPGPQGPALWWDWMGDEAGPPQFPTVRLRGGVALVNVCSSLPTPIFSAQGEVGDAQRARLQAVLEDLGGRGLFRVVLIHHPVADGVVSRRKSLRDAKALREVLRQVGAELILHGHGHEAAVSSAPGPHGPIPILGVPSASAACGFHHAPARWRRIVIHDPAKGDHVTIEERGLCGDGVKVEALGAYRLAIPRAQAVSRVA